MKLTLLFFLSICNFTFAQFITFNNIYTNNGYDFGNGICQLPDSSYALTGGSSSFNEGPSDAFLALIDSTGIYKWSKSYGGLETDWGTRVNHVPDYGYYISGVTNSFGAGGYDFMLIKTDENGTQEWIKTFGGLQWENLHDAIMLADTGMLLVGETKSQGHGAEDLFIVRTDKNGNTLWANSYGTTGTDIAFGVQQWNLDTVLIVGQRWNQDSLMLKAFMMTLKLNGDSLTTVLYPGKGPTCFHDININGTRVNMVGSKTLTNGDRDAYSVTLIPNLTFNFSGGDPLPDDDYIAAVTHYGNQNKLYSVFHTNSSIIPAFIGGRDILIYRHHFNVGWDGFFASYSNSGEDSPGQIIPTSDGGAVFIGSRSTGIGGANVMVVKIGKNDQFPTPNGLPTVNTLVFLSEIEELQHVKIYPNPFNDALILESENNEVLSYALIDNTGKILIQGNCSDKSELITEHLSSGLYFLQLTNGGQNKTIKLIKK
jgi:hypothetical protein